MGDLRFSYQLLNIWSPWIDLSYNGYMDYKVLNKQFRWKTHYFVLQSHNLFCFPNTNYVYIEPIFCITLDFYDIVISDAQSSLVQLKAKNNPLGRFPEFSFRCNKINLIHRDKSWIDVFLALQKKTNFVQYNSLIN
eukprot:TRINITY_DN10747_c0_g1_i1.p1 TRINITY_DN10747_c0_g1~~TRINITY_DN10747_c0_g1_i1.p1  ORF type:complete len:155 (-),score=9.15 TRINITY_DN10747_c0_g1_i1:8-415(-)